MKKMYEVNALGLKEGTREGKKIFYATAWDVILEGNGIPKVFHVKSAGNGEYVVNYMGRLDEIHEEIAKLEKVETTWVDDDGFVHHLLKTEAQISRLKAICDYKHDETKKGTPREFREVTDPKKMAAVMACSLNC